MYIEIEKVVGYHDFLYFVVDNAYCMGHVRLTALYYAFLYRYYKRND